jgi:hypothetical protein
MYQVHFIYQPQEKPPHQKVFINYGVKDNHLLGSQECQMIKSTYKSKFSIDVSIFSVNIKTIWIQFQSSQSQSLTDKINIPIELFDRRQQTFKCEIKINPQITMIRSLDPYCGQYNIHTPQYQTSLEIIDRMNAGIKHLVLVAQMQSGKTGCAKSVIWNLLNYCGYDQKDIFFICGMNDNNLLEQTKTEFTGLIPYENIYFSKMMQKLISDGKLRSHHFSKGPYFLIIDESHYASNSDSLIYKFLRNVMGITADGQIANWTNKNITILSISATPLGELANLTQPNCNKNSIHLKTASNYFGLIDMLDQGLLHQAYNLNTESQRSLFLNLMLKSHEKQMHEGHYKYCVVRLGSQTTKDQLEVQLKLLLPEPAKYINYHSAQAGTLIDFNDIVGQAPSCLTVIWIYDSLRAGKQLQTEHIDFVHDTHGCAPDVSAQGLAGRLCGYGKANYQVGCYTNLPSILKYIDWLKHNYHRGRIPAGGKDIINGFDATNDSHWQCHVPIHFTLPQNLITLCQDHRLKHGKTTYTDELKRDCKDLIIGNTIDQPLITQILNQYSPSKNGGFMILDNLNKLSSVNKNWTQTYSACLNDKAIHGFVSANTEPVNKFVFYVFLNLVPNHSEFGHGLLCYKEYVTDLSIKVSDVKTKDTNLYHPQNWKPKIKIKLKIPAETKLYDETKADVEVEVETKDIKVITLDDLKIESHPTTHGQYKIKLKPKSFTVDDKSD